MDNTIPKETEEDIKEQNNLHNKNLQIYPTNLLDNIKSTRNFLFGFISFTYIFVIFNFTFLKIVKLIY